MQRVSDWLLQHIKLRLGPRGTSYAEKGIEEFQNGLDLWRKVVKQLPNERQGNTQAKGEVEAFIKRSDAELRRIRELFTPTAPKKRRKKQS